MARRDEAFVGTRDEFVGDDGDTLPEDVQAELEALAEAELEPAGDLTRALAEAQRALDEQRDRTRRAVARYRDALLAAEPDLPPDIVRGESIEDVDAAAEAARAMVERIRERVEAARPRERGFPVGAPPRGVTYASMSASEKIAVGLRERES